MRQSSRSIGIQLDDPKDCGQSCREGNGFPCISGGQNGSSPKWTVQGGLTGRSKRLKVNGLGQKWTVQKTKTGRSKGGKLHVMKDESERSKRKKRTV